MKVSSWPVSTKRLVGRRRHRWKKHRHRTSSKKRVIFTRVKEPKEKNRVRESLREAEANFDDELGNDKSPVQHERIIGWSVASRTTSHMNMRGTHALEIRWARRSCMYFFTWAALLLPKTEIQLRKENRPHRYANKPRGRYHPTSTAVQVAWPLWPTSKRNPFKTAWVSQHQLPWKKRFLRWPNVGIGLAKTLPKAASLGAALSLAPLICRYFSNSLCNPESNTEYTSPRFLLLGVIKSRVDNFTTLAAGNLNAASTVKVGLTQVSSD